MRFCCLILLFATTCLPGSARSEGFDFSLLPASERDLGRRAAALRLPEQSALPPYPQTGRQDHTACGTLQTLAVRSDLARASKVTRESMAFLFQRPSRAFSKVSPGGRFRVHYNLSGPDAVDAADADGNGHPDYVDTVAEVFDDVWQVEVVALGYLPPPDDGDGLYDVYVKDLSPTAQFGVTIPESFSLTSPSYIEIENNFTDPVYTTQGLDALRFTAAHEFFHAIQFRYYLSIDAAWWYELTSTWMQDRVVTDINDHYSLVDGYLAFPEAAFYEPPPTTLRPYGAMILAIHMASVYGASSIRATFEDLAARSPDPYTIDDSDRGFPGGFAGVLPRYWVWNYFTGARARAGEYYPEAAGYAEVRTREITPIGTLVLGGATQVESLGATFVRINTAGKSGGLRVTFDLPSGPTWNLDVLLLRGSNLEVVRPAGTTVAIPDAGDYDEVVFIPSLLSLEGRIYDVSYEVGLDPSLTAWSDVVGDFDHSGTVGFEDFLTFADSFGKPPVTQHAPCDLNADGRVDFTDFLTFAGHFGQSR